MRPRAKLNTRSYPCNRKRSQKRNASGKGRLYRKRVMKNCGAYILDGIPSSSCENPTTARRRNTDQHHKK
jgi:hypothetical protein